MSTSYYINPGNYLLHPWLAAIAPNFTSYRYHSFKVHYVQRANATRDGNVLISVSYDPEAAAPPNEVIMSSFQGTKESPIYAPLTYVADPASMMGGVTRKYISSSYNAVDLSNARENDSGLLNVAITGVTTASTVGKLWLEYDVELIDPKRLSLAGEAFPYSAQVTASINVTRTSIFGSAPVLVGGLANALTILNNQITIPVGSWLIKIFVTGTGLFTAFNPFVTAGLGVASTTQPGCISNAGTNAGTTAVFNFSVIVQRGDISPSITLDFTGVSTTIATTSMTVASWSNSS